MTCCGIYGYSVTNPEDAVDEPITLARAKLHLAIEDDNTENDSQIIALISAARQIAERETKRQIVPREVRLSLTELSGDIWLPGGVVRSVDTVTYRDSGNTWRTVTGSTYETLLDFAPPRIVLAPAQFWPTVGTAAVVARVDYLAGWATPDEVPEGLRQAMLLILGNLYFQRGDDKKSEIPPAAMRLLDQWTLPQYG